MTFDDEEQRAAAWRRQQMARREYRRAQKHALAGDPAARTSVQQAWQGFVQWLIERREGDAGE